MAGKIMADKASTNKSLNVNNSSDAALAAIEDALSLSPQAFQDHKEAEVDIKQPLIQKPEPAQQFTLPRNAANDDRRDIGQILHSLQTKVSSLPLWLAFFTSLIWATISGVYFWSRITNLRKLAGSIEAVEIGRASCRERV